jgi:arginase family enzyme
MAIIKLLGIPFDGNSFFLKGSALAPLRIRQMETDGSALYISLDMDVLDPPLPRLTPRAWWLEYS